MSSHWQRQFGEVAIKGGMIDHRGYIKAIDELNVRRRRGEAAMLGQLLIDLGAMSQVDVARVYEILLASAEQTHDGGGRVAADGADTPSHIGRHQLLGVLGEGGMGQVHAARDPELDRVVALKVLHDHQDAQVEKKFVQEARITGALEHPGIVPIHELGRSTDGRAYFTMRRIHGRDLSHVLAEQRPDDRGWLALLPQFVKVCETLGYAHSEGVIHRDLKPANIMIGRYGEVQVVDWGLAKITGEPDETAKIAGLTIDRTRSRAEDALLTMAGAIVGTPAYMPPEQARGEVAQLDGRGDIYSLGVILYEILALRPPFGGRTVWDVLTNVIDGRCPLPSEAAPHRRIPYELDAVVAKAMAKRPSERYATVRDMQADLEAYLQGGALLAVRYSPWQRLSKWTSRRRTLLLGTAAFALTLGASAFYIAHEQRRDRDERERQHAITLDEIRAQLDKHTPSAEKIVETWQAQLDHAGDAPMPPEPEGLREARQRVVRELLDTTSKIDSALAARPGDERATAARLVAGRLVGQLALAGGDYALASWSYQALANHGLAPRLVALQVERIEALRDREQSLRVKRVRAFTDALREGATLDQSVDELVLVAAADAQSIPILAEALEPLVLRARVEGELARFSRTDRELARFAVGALGHLGQPDAVRALERWLAAARALPLLLDAARALARTRAPTALAPLEALRERLGPRSAAWRSVAPELARLPPPSDEPAPADAAGWLARARTRRDQRDPARARADLDRLLALSPGHVEALLLRAELSSELGEPARAKADLDLVVDKDPTGEAYMLRASARRAMGDVAGARGDLDLLLARQADHVEGLVARARLLRETQGDLALAHTDLTRARAASAPTAAILLEVARLHEASGALDLARAAADATLALAPGDADVLRLRARLHRRAGDALRERADLDRALDADSDDVEALVARAANALEAGSVDLARADLTHLARVAPRDWRAPAGLARVHVKGGDRKGARAAYRAALALAPTDATGALEAELAALGDGD